MKRNIIYVMTLLLPLLMGCKQGSNADTDTEAADSLSIDTLQTTEDAQLSTLNSQQIDVEKYWAQFQEMYEEEDLDDIHETLTKYAFIDIDEDGISEVWLRSANDEDGAIFCFDDEGEPVLIITETEGKRPSFGKGWVGVGFPAGGPSYFNHYAIVRNSHLEYDFTDFQVEENHEYYLNETEITEAEAKKIEEGIDFENTEMKPVWKERGGARRCAK